MHVFGKTLRYGLERVAGDPHSKYGAILTNTERVVIDREYHYTCGLTVVKHIPAYYNALLWEAPLRS